MEELDFSKELYEFYEKNKDNNLLLSKDEIIKKSKSRWNLVYGKWSQTELFKKGVKNGVFGFKNHFIIFTNNSLIFEGESSGFLRNKLIECTFDDINLKVDIISEHPLLELGLGDYKITFNLNLKKTKKLIDLLNNELFRNIKIKFQNHKKLEEERLQEQQRLKEEQHRLKEEQRLKKLQVSQTNVLSELDKDGNGEVDVIEGNDFNTLLKKHQKSIVEVDRNYVQQFVKVSSYLKTKKGNIQSIFSSIKDTPNQVVLNEYVEILKSEIHTYNLVLFNSLNMIVSLVEDDMITFYEIHEMFDTINMFDSKHEKDISQKLTNIGDGLESLMYEIRDMGNQISNSIDELSYITEQSNEQLQDQLSEIDSTLKVGNLISVINTYQNYKINKNTKSLRG
jgi:hypothetical protein